MNSSGAEIKYRIYRYKFYLDANHFIYGEDGKKGSIHPHTWEFAIELKNENGDIVPFNEIEEIIKEVLKPFQDKCINNIEPFDEIVPTLENIGEYFDDVIKEKMRERNWTVLTMEISETPSRTYIVR